MSLISESTHVFNGTPKEMCCFVDLGADKIIILRTDSRQRGEESMRIQ
jgi:6-phosphogluconolactonase (cycloisomerase 2 family)